MSPQPRQPRPGEPVHIDVQAERVDATLDLRAVLSGIAANAESETRRRGAGAPPAELAKKLRSTSQAAKQLAGLLDEVEKADPAIRASMERRS